MNAAEVDIAAVIHDAGVLLLGVLDRRTEGRRAAIGQAQHRHGFFTGNHVQGAITDGAFGEGQLGDRLSGFDIARQALQIDAGRRTLVAAQIGNDGFTKGVAAGRRAVTTHRHVRHAAGIHHQTGTAHAVGAMQGCAVRRERATAAG